MKINYKKILQKNLENVLKDVLKIIEDKGLYTGNSLYITFQTGKQNVKIPDWLKTQYPKQMTIIIQNEYWNLNVYDENFKVDLSFNDIRVTLIIPFDSVQSFADPQANFGLQILNKQKSNKNNSKKEKKGDKIIKLDHFRKNQDK